MDGGRYEQATLQLGLFRRWGNHHPRRGRCAVAGAEGVAIKREDGIMNIGEVFDLLESKLRTGEFNRLDPLYIFDGEDHYTVTDLEKCQGEYVSLVSDDLEETVANINADFAASVEVPPAELRK